MSPNLIIQEGALFIADAHDSDERSFFFDFLLHVKQNPPPQLFLMGDMFDLLVGSVVHGVKQYQHYIDLIDEIGKSCEVYYFEGNHDFNLSKLFLHVNVIPLQEQPLRCNLPSGKSCLLLQGAISKKIQNDQRTKRLCKSIENFATQIQRKLYLYPKVDVIAEGHYHQDVEFMVSGVHYINFSSFACNQSCFSVQSFSETEFAHKQLRGCNG